MIFTLLIVYVELCLQSYICAINVIIASCLFVCIYHKCVLIACIWKMKVVFRVSEAVTCTRLKMIKGPGRKMEADHFGDKFKKRFN